MASDKRHQFNRRLWGYRRAAVDRHLETLDDTIEDLRAVLVSHDADNAELVLRATRLSVATVLADANRRADEIVAAAEIQATELRRADDVIDLRSVAEPVEPI